LLLGVEGQRLVGGLDHLKPSGRVDVDADVNPADDSIRVERDHPPDELLAVAEVQGRRGGGVELQAVRPGGARGKAKAEEQAGQTEAPLSMLHGISPWEGGIRQGTLQRAVFSSAGQAPVVRRRPQGGLLQGRGGCGTAAKRIVNCSEARSGRAAALTDPPGAAPSYRPSSRS